MISVQALSLSLSLIFFLFVYFIPKKTITGLYKNLYYVHFTYTRVSLHRISYSCKARKFLRKFVFPQFAYAKSFSSGCPNKFRPKDWQRKKSQIRDLRSNNLFPISNITGNLVLASSTSHGSLRKISMRGQAAREPIISSLQIVETRRNAFLLLDYLRNKHPFENSSQSSNFIRIFDESNSS